MERCRAGLGSELSAHRRAYCQRRLAAWRTQGPYTVRYRAGLGSELTVHRRARCRRRLAAWRTPGDRTGYDTGRVWEVS